MDVNITNPSGIPTAWSVSRTGVGATPADRKDDALRGGGRMFPNTTVALTDWHFMVITFKGDGTEGIEVWMDGIETTAIATTNSTTNQVQDATDQQIWTVGTTIATTQDVTNPPASRVFNGLVYAMGIWDVNLSNIEIHFIYCAFHDATLGPKVEAAELGVGFKGGLDVGPPLETLSGKMGGDGTPNLVVEGGGVMSADGGVFGNVGANVGGAEIGAAGSVGPNARKGGHS